MDDEFFGTGDPTGSEPIGRRTVSDVRTRGPATWYDQRIWDTRAFNETTAPGNHSEFVNADFGAETFKHMLVPVWLLSYRYGAESFQVVVNGYTGEIAGEYPKSAIKIALLILGVLVVVGVVAFLSRG